MPHNSVKRTGCTLAAFFLWRSLRWLHLLLMFFCISRCTPPSSKNLYFFLLIFIFLDGPVPVMTKIMIHPGFCVSDCYFVLLRYSILAPRRVSPCARSGLWYRSKGTSAHKGGVYSVRVCVLGGRCVLGGS